MPEESHRHNGCRVFPGGTVVKNPPAVQAKQETQVQSLVLEGPLEKEMAAHSSILAWDIRWAKEPSRLQPVGLQRVIHNLVITTTTTTDIGSRASSLRRKLVADSWSRNRRKGADGVPAGGGALLALPASSLPVHPSWYRTFDPAPSWYTLLEY